MTRRSNSKSNSNSKTKGAGPGVGSASGGESGAESGVGAGGRWHADLPVRAKRLANGLRVLALERRDNPIVVVDLYYPVGGGDDPPGLSGVAHFVEHMLFKGTERFPKGELDLLTYMAAGFANAETAEDYTHYWFELPSDRWELALAIEADRMRDAVFDPLEFEAERQVIVEERVGDLDTPLGRLDRMHQAMSYAHHPYRNPILGWPEDLARLTVEDLRAFHRRHYRPEGAVLAIVGDVSASEAFAKAEAWFGPLGVKGEDSDSRGAGVVDRSSFGIDAEPAGRREFAVEERDSIARGLFAWRTVPMDHPDAIPLAIVADVLGGGRRGRLWRRLVERDRLAVSLDASHDPLRRAGQLFVQVEAPGEAEPDAIEDAISDEIRKLAERGPTAAELDRVKTRLDAGWRWARQDAASLALGIGLAELRGDWRLWAREHDAILAVTADQARRAAATYLVDRRLTLGWSLPGDDGGACEVSTGAAGTVSVSMSVSAGSGSGSESGSSSSTGTGRAPALSEEGRRWVFRTAPRSPRMRPRRATLENGLRLVTERRETGVLALELHVESGPTQESKPGAAWLTGRVLEETARAGRTRVVEAVEDLGGTAGIGASGMSLRLRAEDLEAGLDFLAAVARPPRADAERFDWIKRRVATDLRADLDDPYYRAEMFFRERIYGSHPNGRDPRGSLDAAESLTMEDVRAHHRAWFAPNNAILGVAGDFDPERLERGLRARLGDWAPRSSSSPAIAAPPEPRASRRALALSGEQAHILMGHLGIRRRDPDFRRMAILDQILGSGPGCADRLGRLVRDELGLAYVVGGGATDSADIEPGMLRVQISTRPEQAEKAVSAAKRVLRALHEGDFDDEEIERAKDYLAGAWVFDLQGDDQRVERLVELERLGLPLTNPKRAVERMRAESPEAIRAAARRHIRPDALTVVVGGPRRPRRASSGSSGSSSGSVSPGGVALGGGASAARGRVGGGGGGGGGDRRARGATETSSSSGDGVEGSGSVKSGGS